MPAIITNQSRVLAADYFSHQIKKVPTYVALGKTSAWDDENDPPAISDSTIDRLISFEEMVAIKRIEPSNVVPVVRRIDWTTSTIYDEYEDSVDLINAQNPETLAFYNFYVLTSEFNVYKCISNNNREPSIIMPSGTSINPFQTADGYIWKYMYSLRSEDVFGFLTANWMPCYSLVYNDSSSQWNVQDSAVGLSIDQIVVTGNGSGYNSSNPPTVTITGDGSSATAVPIINNTTGELTNIVVTNKGSGYTTASVSISGGVGVGATAEVVISPINGHGYNPRIELGGFYVMAKVEIEGDEGGDFPTDLVYRTVSVLSEPLLSAVTGVKLVVSNPEKFSVGDTITQSATGASGTIHSINEPNGELYIKNVTGGIFTYLEEVESNAENTILPIGIVNGVNMPAVAVVVDASDLVEYSGKLLYMSTREPSTRNEFQNESIRMIFAF